MLIYDGYALPQAILFLNSDSRVLPMGRFLSRPLLERSVVMSMQNFRTVP